MPAVTAQSEEMVESGAGAVVAPQIVVHFSKKQPSAADVAQGLAATSRDAGEILRTGNLEKLGRPVMIYQDLRVTDVAIKGKRGSAQVEIDCLALLDGGRMEPQRDGEQLSLQLQRTKRGWAITLPTENSFVPRDAALRILAARLASLTQHDDTNEPKEHEQAQIIRLLSLLVIED
jgi:hypothetical protein